MNKLKLLSIAAGLLLCAESAQAVSPVVGQDSPKGALTGRNIAMWQSHGRYYDAADDRWKWQRCRLFGTVEDLYTRSYVVPFLVPMLENAGAYVMLPRERDANTHEIVIDADGGYAVDGYRETHHKQKWHDADSAGFGLPVKVLTEGVNPFKLGSARYVHTVRDASKISTASWSAAVAESGDYAVYVSYPRMAKAVTDAHYTVHTAIGDRHFKVNQTMGAGTWIYLGTMPFAASKEAVALVTLTNLSESDGVVSADAVRIGGGMGNVVRGEAVSGMPRWAEASRYWLQWAGMPDSIYANQESDYRDDIFCRPQWVNYLRDEMNIPVDLAMAFHSDAGTLGGDSIVGTLGIYYTERKRGRYTDGRSKRLGEKLCGSIVGSVVSDIRRGYDSQWTQRKMRDAKYIEARVPDVPTMLLELLSHQNLADMRYGLDPQFKFDVSRAVYKGILRYLSGQGLAKYIVQPLAPRNLALTELSAGSFELSWLATADTLEPTAMPTSYIVEVRVGSNPEAPFERLAELNATELKVDIPDGEIRSYRVIARNGGGVSFPSEVMAAGYVRAGKGTVTVVNGFTRVSAPDDFDAADMAGFGLTDPGVSMGCDLSFTGRQYDFDRTSLWVHDDNPGFGASRADMETKPVYGNSFDYIVTHGAALMAAGYGFDSRSVAAFCNDSRRPEIIDLILGLQKTVRIGRGERAPAHRTLPPALRERLRFWAENGVPMMVTGANVASDSEGDNDANEFLQTVLGVRLRSDRASWTGGVAGVRSRYCASFAGVDLKFSTAIGERPYAVASPDAIYPASVGGETIMRYAENQSPAGVAYVSSTHKAVTLGFPFEAVNSAARQHALMNKILQFLNNR